MRSKTGSALLGAGAGLVAGLALTLVQVLARLALGVGLPQELIGDRVAPLLTIRQFFGLFDAVGGYQHLKQLGVGGNTLGQLAVAVVLGMVYALTRRRPAGARRALPVLAGLTALLWLALVALLWPNLVTNFRGLPPGPARVVTIAVMGTGFAVFVLVLVAAHRVLTGRPAVGGTAAPQQPAASGLRRRAVLVGGVGAGLALATGAAGDVLYRRATFGYDGTQYNPPQIAPITPVEEFYVVTKNVIDPRVDAGLWDLTVGGAVERERSWGFAALIALLATTQETTLMCISNAVGWGLESNASWTGVPLRELIAAAGPRPGVVAVLLTAVDGYTDTIPIDTAMDPTTLVAYRMNGQPLPQRHGYPARMIVPGMFGEKNVKWLTRVDLVTHETKGFYEHQGWGPNFVVPTRSRFVNPDLSRPLRAGVPVALRGTANGGNRGISAVEVSTDDGRSWQPAVLEHPGTRLSWALWRYDWTPPVAGSYRLVVRATDGTGAPQSARVHGIIPEGATGYHRVLARVNA